MASPTAPLSPHWFRSALQLAQALPALAALALGACSKAPPPPALPVAEAPSLDPSDPKKLLAAVDALSGAQRDRPKPYEVMTALGNLYYENGRYLDAVDILRQAIEKATPIQAAADALRARGIKPAAALPAACLPRTPDVGQEQIAAAAKKLEPTDPAAALRCDDEAIASLNDVRARRADALYLIGQPDAALAEHQRVLARQPDAPESLFFVGAITLEQSNGDKAKLEEGKKAWRRLLEVAPKHPRAALVRESLPKAEQLFAPKAEGARSGGAEPAQLQPGHPSMAAASAQPGQGAAPAAQGGPTPEQVQNIADAVGQTERTPELESGLDALLVQAEGDLDAGRFQQARDKMVRVMPMRPADPRTAADLGAAMAGLGKLEMAERVLSRALAGDPQQPRALVEMGKLLAARGDKAGARAKFAAAQAADAKFAAAHGVDGALRRLE